MATDPALVVLNGEVVNWDETASEDALIGPEQVGDFEARGFLVTTLGGHLYAVRFGEHADGTIQLQQKSTAEGREAQKGGHTNWGFAGYFRGFVILGGKRKTLVDWYTLFPGREHHFLKQQDTPAALDRIRTVVAALAGRRAHKVKGGYALTRP